LFISPPSSHTTGFQGNADLLDFKVERKLLEKVPIDFVEKAMGDGQVCFFYFVTQTNTLFLFASLRWFDDG
jgi:hypothetical protein